MFVGKTKRDKVPVLLGAKKARQSARYSRDKVPVDNSLYLQVFTKYVDKPVEVIDQPYETDALYVVC